MKMAMDSNRQQREQDKFEETSGGDTAIRTLSKSKLVNSEYDYIGVTYSDTVTEIYVYKFGGSGGTTVATITVVYTDSTKEFVSSVTKT